MDESRVKEWCTASVAAQMLGVPPRQVAALVESGRLTAVPHGAPWIFDPDQVDGVAAELAAAASPPAAAESDAPALQRLPRRTAEPAAVESGSSFWRMIADSPLGEMFEVIGLMFGMFFGA